MKKNDIVTLDITDLNSAGQGVARKDDMAVFVKHALPGESVVAHVMSVKKSYAFGKLIHIINTAEERIDPPCKIFGKCGGCDLQHLQYAAQLAYKRKKVVDALRRIGGIECETLSDTIGMDAPFGYRNKAAFPVAEQNGRTVLGMYAERSHRVIPLSDCRILLPNANRLLNVLSELIAPRRSTALIQPYNEETGKGILRHVMIRASHATGEMMICFVVNNFNNYRFPNEERLDMLKLMPNIKSIVLNSNVSPGNAIMGKHTKTLYGEDRIHEVIGGVRYAVSADAFFQINTAQTEKLYALVADYAQLTGEEIIWDIYCGVGGIALYLARQCRYVIGVEINAQAVSDARHNAKINNITNVEFFAANAPSWIEQGMETRLSETPRNDYPAPDVIILDPPRKGCERPLLDALLKIRPMKIIYVSCDPATLARDARVLRDGGYTLRLAAPVDMFPQTCHIETAALLQRQ
ncbi:MAG: 23S rRNA (uracil(1939)-C(5))-methyltransferase RlmD [Clostridiales bacterium]|jgi:23S rRNA (uracil1939-C5)-methyltransferase|nr:23S rRNA (uracil(1939)-C(5))-methyltransferase RlmD [Clostridiales bacterium]